jgi:SAM-dependent methyltransferase
MFGTGLFAPIYQRFASSGRVPKPVAAPSEIDMPMAESVAPPVTSAKSPDFDADLAHAGAAWREIMAPHRDEFGIVAFPRPLALKTHHLAAGARLFADRWMYLDSLAAGGICAEVGVHTGNYSAEILMRARPQKLHLIDIDLRQFAVKERFASEAAAGVVHFHEGHSVDMLNAFPAGYFDWIYLDADHRYESVRNDARAAADKLKPDGLLIFNDYTLWSYTEAMLYGVVHVVNEMCVNEGWRVAAFSLSDKMYCDIAIRRA